MTTCSSVSIVNFEHVIAGWDKKSVPSNTKLLLRPVAQVKFDQELNIAKKCFLYNISSYYYHCFFIVSVSCLTEISGNESEFHK